MDPILIFTTAFLVGFSGAVMPGPVTAVMAEQTIKRGFTAAPLVTAGHAIMEALVVVLLAAGLGSLMAGENVAGVIGIAGGAVLAWMGWGMVRGARSASLVLQDPAVGPGRKTGPVSAGLVATVVNPYWFLWWATVGAGYVALSQEHGLKGIVLFFSGHILADFAWLSLLAVVLASGKRWISDRVYRGIITVLGLFLICLAAYFFWTGIRFVIGEI
ncbi:MAG: LysE family transporter [Bacillota bacterium]